MQSEMELRSVLSNSEVMIREIADGGEGSLELLSKVYECRPHQIEINNAIGKKIMSTIGYNQETQTAILEMASYVGLAQLEEVERNPKHTSSFGLGQAILQAVELGATRIILGIGGSATNDGGAGMIHALGFAFFDKKGVNIYPTGGNLDRIQRIEQPNTKTIEDVNITIASDVNNPITGTNGATYTYGPQKWRFKR